METVSGAVMPAVLLLAALPMLSRRRDFFEVFIGGAREGLMAAVRLLPAMIALMVALSMFQASGAVAFLTGVLGGAAEKLGIPVEILPLLVTRPVSGSASTAAYASLLETAGVDSFAAFCASVLMGSSDTLIYVITVYFSGTAIRGQPPVKKTRYAFFAAVCVMILCIFLSAAVSRLFFSGAGA